MDDHDDADARLSLGQFFPEPERPKTPPATVELYHRHLLSKSANAPEPDRGPERLQIHLVGQHPLWGHHLWNASKCFATFLDENREKLCRGRRVLELGAGGGLPGLICALNQAKSVVLTDYPDPDLISNLKTNVQANLSGEALKRTTVQGFVWGSNVAGLLNDGSYDLLILSDLVFNHSQHSALLKTCDETLTRSVTDASSLTPCALVFFTHHRPWLADKDLEFFAKAKEKGWKCEQILQVHTGAMFKDDAGDETVRGTVHGWRMWRT